MKRLHRLLKIQIMAIIIFCICIFGSVVIKQFPLSRDYYLAMSLMNLSEPGKIDSLRKKLEDNPELVRRKFRYGDTNISLVHMVCKRHNLEGIQYLKTLDADFSQETKFRGDTPLIILSETFYPNSLECIREVVESKFVGKEGIVKSNKYGNSPIVVAITGYMPNILEEYLSIITINNIKVDKTKLLQLAVRELRENDDGIKIVSALVAAGARPAEKNEEDLSPIEIAREIKKNSFLEIMTK